jgi:hypothetical protein
VWPGECELRAIFGLLRCRYAGTDLGGLRRRMVQAVGVEATPDITLVEIQAELQRRLT